MLSKFPGSDESKRARRLREAMRFNGRGGQQAFAEFLGVERSTWNNVECGAPLGKEMALRIVRKFPGVTLDWLFLGIAAVMRLLCGGYAQSYGTSRPVV